MIEFDDFDALKNFLRADSGQRSVSPVRFINVDNLSDWFALKNFLGTLTTNFLLLSDFCAGEDTFPNLRRLREQLRQVNENVCVVPLSEVLRLEPELAELETKNFLSLRAGELCTSRIYFPIYRLKKFFLSLKVTDPRQKDCVLLCTAAEPSNYSLTIIQRSMRLSAAGAQVDGFKRYLQQWEKSPRLEMTLFTENAVHLQDKNFFDDVKVVANAFDLLRGNYALPAALQRNFGRDDDWQRLATSVARAGDFERAFCEEFKVDGFGVNVFENFGGLDKFRRWLLWLRCKLNDGGYAALCAKNSSSPEEFAEKLYVQIFSCYDENFSDERREILSRTKMSPPESFCEQARHADKKIALKALTDASHVERLLCFELLQKFRFNESAQARKILRKNFPALAEYLSDGLDAADIFTAEQSEYFRRYRWLKVTNRLTEDFNRRVTDIALNGGEIIYATPSRNQLVNAEASDGSAIFFVDGLGAEYLNFLAEEFSSLEDKFSIRYRVGRCNLPSVTELNKDFLHGKNVACELLELDALKHDGLTYPENILRELDFLSSLKDRLIRSLDAYRKVILCSDHGTSRLAVLARQKNLGQAFPADGRQVYTNGRFADADNDAQNFPTALETDGKIIFADYSRFLRQGSPGCEIHGGASLEEVLVPVVTIERREKVSSSGKRIRRGIAVNKNFDI